MKPTPRWLPLSCAFLTSFLATYSALAATHTVTSLNDSGPGSLREWIGASIAGDTIDFAANVTGTINIQSELVIGRDLTINGPGADKLSIRRDPGPNNLKFRIFHVILAKVTIAGLTITNGQVPDGQDGGGISNEGGNLTLSECTVEGNWAGEDAESPTNGGGLASSQGALPSYLDVILNISSCTFSNNRAYSGGAISGSGFGRLTMTNTTISGNFATHGGGIHWDYQSHISFSTIVRNSASASVGGLSHGTNVLNLQSCIVALNDAPDRPDFYFAGPFFTAVYNLIGAFNEGFSNYESGFSIHDNLVGTTVAPIDPLLGDLQYHGGPTKTIAPRYGSAAIDHGGTDGAAPPATDQRGSARTNDNPYVVNGSGGATDIGAYETSTPIAAVNLNDGGVGSLREAISGAPPNGWIVFNPGVSGTLTLTSGELLVDKNLTIAGPGAKLLTINGNNASRIFNVTSGSVDIAGFTLASASSADGTIRNASGADLSVADCAISGNLAWGIYNNGNLQIRNSTLSGNGGTLPAILGGGIWNLGAAAVDHCTFYGNRAPVGGGIRNDAGTLFVTSCTFYNNTAGGSGLGLVRKGGGIYNETGATAEILSSIVASNHAGTAGEDLFGAFLSDGYNLIGKIDGSTGITNGTNNDQAGTSAAPLTSGLTGALADNGGSTLTIALQVNSPAIDKGYRNGKQLDQRGWSRTVDNPVVANAPDGDGADIGAYELDSNLRILAFTQSGSDLKISFPDMPGASYFIDGRADLLGTSSWHSLVGLPGNGRVREWTLTNAINQSDHFFRVRMTAP